MLRTGRIHDKKLFSFQMFRRRIKHHTASSNNIKAQEIWYWKTFWKLRRWYGGSWLNFLCIWIWKSCKLETCMCIPWQRIFISFFDTPAIYVVLSSQITHIWRKKIRLQTYSKKRLIWNVSAPSTSNVTVPSSSFGGVFNLFVQSTHFRDLSLPPRKNTLTCLDDIPENLIWCSCESMGTLIKRGQVKLTCEGSPNSSFGVKVMWTTGPTITLFPSKPSLESSCTYGKSK